MSNIAALFIYPIKACGAVALTQVEVTSRGLMTGAIGDRRWMIVDEHGTFLSQRDLPQMAKIKIELNGHAAIRASVAGHPTLDLQPSDAIGEQIAALVHDKPVTGHRVNSHADQWFSSFLEKDVRLLYQTEEDIRYSSPHFSPRPGVDIVSFADGYQILLTNQSTLDRLNESLSSPVPMSRFRPNIVIAGAKAEAEYGWRKIAIGDAKLTLAKPCTRCVVTTIDQDKGEKTGKEPLATLAKHYFLNQDFNGKLVQGAVFGENVIPVVVGPIATGMTVTIEETKPAYAFRGRAMDTPTL